MALRDERSNNSDRGVSGASAAPRSQQIRRVSRVSDARINNDWQYLESQTLPNNATTDQVFNASYQKRGLQPRPLTKETRKLDQSEDTQRVANDDYYPAPRRVLSKKTKKPTASLMVLARLKATAVNTAALVWTTPLWLFVQLPFALLCVIMLGAAGAIEGAREASRLADLVAGTVNAVSSVVSGFFGFDGSILDIAPALAMVSYLLVLAIGFLILFSIYLQYTLALLKPLSGEKSSLKKGIFLLAIIGYSVPLLNIFPWAMIWTMVVWKYPK